MTIWLTRLWGARQTPEISRDDLALESYFTNVTRERQLFEELVLQDELERRLINVYGPGGVGKSTLLHMYYLFCRRRNIPVALVSGDRAKTPAALIDGWAKGLKECSVRLPGYEVLQVRFNEIQAKIDKEAAVSDSPLAEFLRRSGQELAGPLVEAFLQSQGVDELLSQFLGKAIDLSTDVMTEPLFETLSEFLTKEELDFFLNPARKMTPVFLADLDKEASKRRLVLMLDTYEQIREIDDWVSGFVHQLNENILTVICGRRSLANEADPERDWYRKWPSLAGRAYLVELREFGEENTRQLILNYSQTLQDNLPDEKLVDDIVMFGNGLPLAITTAVRLARNRDDFEEIKPQVVNILANRLLEGIPQELQRIFELAAFLRWFNQELLQTLLPEEPVAEIYKEFLSYPFVEPHPKGFTVQDHYRQAVELELSIQQPERYRLLHQQAATFLADRVTRMSQDSHDAQVIDVLYHLSRADEEKGLEMFIQLCEELVRTRWLHRLQEILTEVSSFAPQQHRFQKWLAYYRIRMMAAQMKLPEAEAGCRALSEQIEADHRLLAYVNSELGWLLTRFSRFGRPGTRQEAQQILRRSLELHPLDTHLVGSLFSLATVASFDGNWEAAMTYLKQAKEFFVERNDKYGMVQTYVRMKNLPGFKGDFHWFFELHTEMRTLVEEMPRRPYLRADLADWAFMWFLAGRYGEAERYARERLAILEKLGDYDEMYSSLRDLGLILGRKARFDEASTIYEKGIERRHDLGASALGFWGAVLTWQGTFKEAEEKLLQSLAIKNQQNDAPGLPEVHTWLGNLYGKQQVWDRAMKHYQLGLETNTMGRRYFEIECRIGLLRARYHLDQIEAWGVLASQVDAISQEFEYNDHLAHLRLLQAMAAWNGRIELEGGHFENTLSLLQETLVYALRYNCILLDEITDEVIGLCREWGDDGIVMLQALATFWSEGKNTLGLHHKPSVSPIRYDLDLVAAEKEARQNEFCSDAPHTGVLARLSNGSVLS